MAAKANWNWNYVTATLCMGGGLRKWESFMSIVSNTSLWWWWWWWWWRQCCRFISATASTSSDKVHAETHSTSSPAAGWAQLLLVLRGYTTGIPRWLFHFFVTVNFSVWFVFLGGEVVCFFLFLFQHVPLSFFCVLLHWNPERFFGNSHTGVNNSYNWLYNVLLMAISLPLLECKITPLMAYFFSCAAYYPVHAHRRNKTPFPPGADFLWAPGAAPTELGSVGAA